MDSRRHPENTTLLTNKWRVSRRRKQQILLMVVLDGHDGRFYLTIAVCKGDIANRFLLEWQVQSSKKIDFTKYTLSEKLGDGWRSLHHQTKPFHRGVVSIQCKYSHSLISLVSYRDLDMHYIRSLN
jgi:hypothetical protein